MSTIAPLPMFVGGQWIDTSTVRPVLDPGTGRPFAHVFEGDEGHVTAAVTAARSAFDDGPWPDSSVAERAGLLRRVADDLAARNRELIDLDCRNVGTPIAQGLEMMGLVPDVFRYYADLIETREREGPESIGRDGTTVEREAVGVVVAIAPWNYPLWQAAGKVAAAIAAGCTVVLKPSSLTPLSAYELAIAFDRAGAPRGVLNVVFGPGSTLGAALALDPRVDKISFTGGTESGIEVGRSAFAGGIRRLALELGGKSPNIVFGDADMDAAVAGALSGIFENQGEVCSAGSRLLLQRPIRDAFIDRLLALTRDLTIGYQMDPATRIGPLVAADHAERVLAHVAQGVAEGATLLIGGRQASVPGYEGGFYVEPTIFSDVDPAMSIAREEIFGPVLAIQVFDDEAEAIKLANDTVYGLAAGVWSRDEARIRRVSSAVRAGVVFVNSYHSAGLDVPWGGFGQSGIGRELGTPGLDSFTELKSVVQVPAG